MSCFWCSHSLGHLARILALESFALQVKLAQLLPVEVQNTQVLLGFHWWCAVIAHDAQSLCIQVCLECNPSDALGTACQLAAVEQVFLAVLYTKGSCSIN